MRIGEEAEEEGIDVEGDAEVALYSFVCRFTHPGEKAEGLGGAVIEYPCMEEVIGDNVVEKPLSEEAKRIPAEEIDILNVVEYGYARIDIIAWLNTKGGSEGRRKSVCVVHDTSLKV